MATPIQKGTAVIDSVSGTISGYASTALNQNAKATQNFQMGEIKDASGFDANLSSVNEFLEMDFEFIPAGASRSAAVAIAVFLAPLTKVTLASFQATVLNGDWILMSGTMLDVKNGPGASQTLKLRKYADSTQNTALTAAALS